MKRHYRLLQPSVAGLGRPGLAGILNSGAGSVLWPIMPDVHHYWTIENQGNWTRGVTGQEDASGMRTGQLGGCLPVAEWPC